MTNSPREYAEAMLSYAQMAREQTDLPVSVILAQWGLETAWGGSELAVQYNNHGGIKYVGESIAIGPAGGSAFAAYASKKQFTEDYIRVMQLHFYDHVRAAGRSGSPYDVAKALGHSPYDQDGYAINDVRGAKIMGILDNLPWLIELDGRPAEPLPGLDPRLAIGAAIVLLVGALVAAGRSSRRQGSTESPQKPPGASQGGGRAPRVV